MGQDDPVRFGAEFGPTEQRGLVEFPCLLSRPLCGFLILVDYFIRHWDGVDDKRVILVRNLLHCNRSGNCTLPFEL